MLSSDINPSDASLIEIVGEDDIPSNAPMGDYGYESDSDLDDSDDLDPVANPEIPKDQFVASSPSTETQPKDSNE